MTQNYEGLRSGTFIIQAQERIVFGQPIASSLPAELEQIGAKRVLVTSSRSLTALKDGPLQWVERALGSRLAGRFVTIRAHSPREDVIAGAQAARDVNADLLVAVGGGSVIDATKAMLMCLWHDLRGVDAMEPFRGGAARATRRNIEAPANAIRMVSVSTTLSAADFTAIAGVTESGTQAKQSFTHRLFAPRVVLLDPAATFDTPQWLLYATGIRSIDHAVESYCAPAANPATEVLSLHGLTMLSRALRAMKADPASLQARSDAQIGMWQAITATMAGAGTGASHGIGYVLGAGYNVAHGHTSCVMLPAVMRWNAAVNAERQKALAKAIGEPDRNAADQVAELIADLGQPGTLRSINIKREDLETIAQRALDYPNLRANPRSVTSAEQVREILELAW